jgi:hypothetical protein
MGHTLQNLTAILLVEMFSFKTPASLWSEAGIRTYDASHRREVTIQKHKEAFPRSLRGRSCTNAGESTHTANNAA